MLKGSNASQRRRIYGPTSRSQRKILKLVNQGYGDAGASGTKRSLKGFTALSGSPDRDINDQNYTLRQRSRMLYMSSPLATSAIVTNRTNVVGTGLVPKPAIDSESLGMSKEEAIAWQRAAEREFSIWADDKRCCDATGVNDFYALQQLALMSWLMSGDVFALVKSAPRRTPLQPYKLRLHLIEADRVGSPTPGLPATGGFTTTLLPNGNYCHDGVEVDRSGAIVAYHIRNSYPQEINLLPDSWKRVKAYGARTGMPNVLHAMDAERPEQYRGVPYLAKVIEPVLQLRRYTESELTASWVQSCFTAFILTQTDPTTVPLPELDEDGEPMVSEDEDELEMGPGMINHLLPGESVSFGNPSRPYTGFDSFVKNIATQVGAALEIPSELLLKTFTSSYSASRAALMEAWKGFQMRRVWFVNDFCQPVWELFISEAVALGRLNAPGFFTDPLVRKAYLGCNWIGPSQGQLDPTKEISAEILALEQGLTTHRDAAIRLNGSNWDGNVDQLGYENERLASITPFTDAIKDAAINRVAQDAVGGQDEGTGDEEQAQGQGQG